MFKKCLEFMFFLCLCKITQSQLQCEKALSYIGCTTQTDNNVLERGVVSDDSEITYISLTSCGLSHILEQSFAELPTLATLDLSLNSLQTIDQGVFDNLNSVQMLNLSRNAIYTLPVGTFTQMTSLIELDISYNQLQELTLGILDPLEYLNKLSLSHNSLLGLPLGIFNSVAGIVDLNLSYNDLSTAPLGIFDPLKYLEILDVSWCNFGNMESGMFDENKQLQQLFLSGNSIQQIHDKHFHDLQQMIKLDLSNNQIFTLQKDVFEAQANLRHLNISSNLLEDATPLNNLQNLRELDASKNKISYVSSINLPALTYLDFSSNRLTNFGTNVGMSIPRRLKTFRLHNNPWQCGCLQQLLEILSRRKISYVFGSYFQGKKPVCVVVKNASRCVRDNRLDRQVYNTYKNELKRYPKD